jgi:hypothetical protein
MSSPVYMVKNGSNPEMLELPLTSDIGNITIPQEGGVQIDNAFHVGTLA